MTPFFIDHCHDVWISLQIIQGHTLVFGNWIILSCYYKCWSVDVRYEEVTGNSSIQGVCPLETKNFAPHFLIENPKRPCLLAFLNKVFIDPKMD